MNPKSSKFLRSLAKYSALSGAVIGGLNQAQATIQYTSLSDTPFSDGVSMIYLPAGSLSFFERGGTSSAMVYLRGGVEVSGAGTWYPNRLDASQNVSSGGTWRSAASQFLGWNGTTNTGLFMGHSGKFLGFRFNSGGIKYGWVRLDVAANGASITLTDWAYQDDGSSILTGDTGASLPIELLKFQAQRFHQLIHLDWTTATEENFDEFVLERAEEGAAFQEIARIAGAGNPNQEQSYTHQDKAILDSRRYYYRLKSIDLDGSFTYSSVVDVAPTGADFLVSEPYPNPITTGEFELDIELPEAEDISISIFASTGQLVYEKPLNLTEGKNTVQISVAGLSAGTYFLKLRGRYHQRYQRIVVE